MKGIATGADIYEEVEKVMHSLNMDTAVQKLPGLVMGWNIGVSSLIINDLRNRPKFDKMSLLDASKTIRAQNPSK
jgi:hypothetical protein